MTTTDQGRTFSLALSSLAIAPDEAAVAARQALSRPFALNLAETVVGHLARRASRTPDALAVIHKSVRITCAELLAHVHALREQLIAAGIQEQSVVACGGPRSATTLALFLALESLGAVYLPVDPAWPEQRVASVLERSKAALLVDYRQAGTSEDVLDSLRAAAAKAATPLLTPTVTAPPVRTADDAQHEADAWPVSRSDMSEARYAFYTSGTTGVPKGALNEHQGMINHLWAKVIDHGLTPADIIAFNAPLVFDISIWQMLVPALTGSVMVVIDDADVRFPRRLLRELAEHRVTVLEAVPTLLRLLAEELAAGSVDLAELRWVISTGEELLPSTAGALLAALPGVHLSNAWGFTETSDDLTHHVVRPQDLDERRLPVGSAVVNAVLYVLTESEDGTWRAADPGKTGEIFVGGVAVCRGYLEDPTATEAAFYRDIINPASPSGRLYRSGDAGMIKDGLLHYLGRLDRQVKVKGVRMELGEIEAVLARHTAIAQCAVLVTGDGEDKELVACYVSRDGSEGAEPPHKNLQTHVRASVPEAMVPTHWVPFSALPLNGNGKVNHSELQSMLKRTA